MTHTKNTEKDLTELLAAAEQAVEVFEAIPNGEPYAAQRREARAALDALRARALDRVSRFEPWGADVIADFEFLIRSAKGQNLANQLIAVMPGCIESHPRLARLLVSPPVIELVRSCNETPGAPQREFEIECEYLQAQCANLTGRDEFEPGATIMAEISIALAQRCLVADERLEAFVEAERARMELEQRQAAEVIAAEDRRRRAVVAEFFRSRSGQRFFLRDRVFSGAGLSQAVNGVGLRDQEAGEFVQLPTIDELEMAMKRALAAETVTA